MTDNKGNGNQVAVLKETNKLIFTKLDYLKDTVDDMHDILEKLLEPEGSFNKTRAKVTRHDEKIKSLYKGQAIHWALFIILIGLAVKSLFGG